MNGRPLHAAPAECETNPLRCVICEYVAANKLDLQIHDCGPEVLRCKAEIRAVLRAIERAPERAVELVAHLRQRVRGL